MDFVLVLHSHLPYVLNHGRWPHGSDWLCEAALDTYLPLYDHLASLADEGVPAPVTLGITPVLANQLCNVDFEIELERFIEHRLELCREAAPSLVTTGDGDLVSLVTFWEAHLRRLRDLFRSLDRDLVSAFRGLEQRGAIEIITSAATHGFLPLLARDESIRLQLSTGRSEHRRLFHSNPRGCWLPECAYRPRGRWDPMPGERRASIRRGTEEHLSDFGLRFFITDAHLAHAGTPLEAYADGMNLARGRGEESGRAARTPYRAYRVSAPSARRPVAALVRDPESSKQVWSRQQGYPGDEWYLEFHKIRWPHGLRLWRVTGPGVDLGLKRPYEPQRAREKARDHAEHFAHVLSQIARSQSSNGGVIVAPFDTELLGHWWFEGVDFLSSLYRRLDHDPLVRPVTGSRHLADHLPRRAVRLAEGSWGARGDFSMWLNPDTAWTWRRMWALEDAFWVVAEDALSNDAAHPVLAQAARELLLAQASDWQFIVSTGVVRDYGERRFVLHCDSAERLVAALRGDLEAGHRLAEELSRQDDLFPNVLDSVAVALGRRRVRA
ncbi:MAG: DUF1957 domain-containing protein [Gemmatimonadetes bacterium]|nr:DUF1957 domain-containing protein [Gemmatimonadota bacterium]